jgi:putative hemolysin
MEEIVQEYLLDLIVILSLVFVNGILAMIELAIVSSSRAKMENLARKSIGAKIALELMDNPGLFLSTIQIGITIIGIIAGAFSGQKFAEPLAIWLNTFTWIYGHGNLIAFTLVVASITYISIVIGELIPKRIAITKPEKVAIFFARSIRLLSKITYPIVEILDLSTTIVLRIFNQKEIKDSVITEEEIHSVIKQGLEGGTLDDFEHKTFQKVLEFGDREASIIMTPRIKVVYLDMADSMDQNIQKILQNPHRYYPLFDDGLNNLKGIIDIKDVLIQQIQGKKLDLKTLVKEAPCVIEDNLGPDLLDQFKKYKTQIVVVVDEYGTLQGIITLVDLFETLIGSTSESQEKRHYEIIIREDGSLLCDGLTPIDEIEELLKVDIVETFEENAFNTLAGFLLIHFKHIPIEGEFIVWDKFRFDIVGMDGSRIDKVSIQREEKLYHSPVKKVEGARSDA